MKGKLLSLLIAVLLLTIVFSGCFEETPIEKQKQEIGDSVIDMLIFLSPQYSHDEKIKQSINRYIDAVKSDIGWNTTLIFVEPENNTFWKIDKLIEQYYEKHPLKATIMVGEDINTALSADTLYEEEPSVTPWITTGGNASYTLIYNLSGVVCPNGQVLGQSHRMDICVSLIYPTHDLSYEIKSSQISSVFQKFSNNRNRIYQNLVRVLISSEQVPTKQIYQTMDSYTNFSIIINPTNSEIIDSLVDSYKMLFVAGHSSPERTLVNYGYQYGYQGNRTNFYADDLDNIDTPLFGATGCYVGGWWSNETDNNYLDYSINQYSWYGSKIFKNPYLRVMVLGDPAQSGGTGQDNFIMNAVLPLLTTGKTLAECMIGHVYDGGGDSEIIYGDPTFHYNELTQPASHILAILPGGSTIDGTNFSGPVSIRVITWNISSLALYVDGNIVPSDSMVNEKGSHTILAIGYDDYGIETERESLNIIIT